MTVSSLLKQTGRYLRLIDFRALSGLTRMLGIEFEGEELIRVTHLARKGMRLRKLSARFEVLTSLVVRRTPDEPAEAVGGRLALALNEAAITTRVCVIGIRQQKMRTVEVRIPSSVRDEDGWISEHAAELLKLPMTGGEFAFRRSRVEPDEGGDRIQVAFVRNSELDRVRQMAAHAGLDVCALLSAPEVAAPLFRRLLPEGTEVVGSASLAVAGFFPELAEADFLSPGEHEEVERKWAKNLFRRAALATGITLLILLLLESVTSRLLARRLSELNEEHAALAPQIVRVEELDKRVTSLQLRLGDQGSTLARTGVTKVLYTVANSTPGEVRLLQIQLQAEGSMTLRGYAKEETGVTRFLKDLASRFPEVKLVRSKVARKGIETGTYRITQRDKWEFEMLLNRKVHVE